MANTISATKRVRQTRTRTIRNRVVKSRVKTARKRFAEAIEAGDSEKSQSAFKNLASAADRAAKRGVIHKNSASRLKSEASKVLAGAGK